MFSKKVGMNRKYPTEMIHIFNLFSFSDPSPEREARTALLTNGGVHEMVVIKTETAMPVTGISSDTTNTSATTTTSAV